MPSRLIVVEGLPGSGKSSFAQAIQLGCQGANRPARWYSELEVDHPLDYVYRPEQDASVEAHFETCRAAWQRFLARAVSADGAEQTVIVDAWFLQDPVFGLLLADVEHERIARGMVELWSLLPRTSTTVLYLTRREVAAAVDHLCETRGEHMRNFYVGRNDRSRFAASRTVSGASGLIRFWTEHRDICDAVLQASSLNTVVEDVSEHDWEVVTTRVLAAFDLERSTHEEPNCERYGGSYLLDAKAGTFFEVVAAAGRLLLRNFPFFWRNIDQPLIPCGNATFAVQSWPASVSFELERGTARALIVSELHRCGQSPWPAGIYPRA